MNTVRWATRVHELEHAITSFLNEYAKEQQPHGGIGEEPMDGDTIAFHARRILGKYAISTMSTTTATTTATMTESEAKAFVDQAAQRLVEEFKTHYVYLTIYTSRYGGDCPQATLRWAATIDRGNQISADTLDKLVVKLREGSGADAKLAKIAELRKQADELEASIAKETVGV